MTITASAAQSSERVEWRLATVVRVIQETSTAWTLAVHVPGWPGHRAGQYVDVRLIASDGQQPQRSFSIASAPEDENLALTIERLTDGEVSAHLCGQLREGDRFELRGPFGSFTWDVADQGPLFLVAGGSGIVPLMAMLRHRAIVLPDAAARRALPARLLYSSRRANDVIFRAELERLAAEDDSFRVTYTITRARAPDWNGPHRRIDRAMLVEAAWPPAERPRIFVCGPAPLVSFVAAELLALGHDPSLIKMERFGPTGATNAPPVGTLHGQSSPMRGSP